MDELAVLAEMRSEVPTDTRYPDAQRALMAEIASGPVARTRLRKPLAIGAAVLAGAVAASAFVALGSGNSRHAPPSPKAAASGPKLRLVAVTSPMTLASNASALAQDTPLPTATQWIYQRLQTTISKAAPSGAMPQVPGSKRIREKWSRVDGLKFASIQGGRLVTANGMQGAAPLGWPQSITYPYLASLPTDPVRLSAQIRQNIVAAHTASGNRVTDSDVFGTVVALMENYPVLPAKLNAALYGVLARLGSVRLGHVTDLAGRSDLSLYNVDQGLKTSLLINPTTYTYAGQQIVVVADRTETGSDGELHLKKGELLNDEAVLAAKIVDNPGQR